ncbi:hypothetical protein ACT17Q_12695 [Cellulomonas sp. CW35]|uniref:hypothetical protein n=1 Tax=Cellulomonas sp. CW35 TaxID=3458249 RepID=UPI00403465F0
MTPDVLAAAKRVAAEAPPLSDEQRRLLTGLATVPQPTTRPRPPVRRTPRTVPTRRHA